MCHRYRNMNAVRMLGGLVRFVAGMFVLAVVAATALVAFPDLRQIVTPVETVAPTPGIDVRFTPIAPAGTYRATLTDAELGALVKPYFPHSFVGIVVSEPKPRAESGHVAVTGKAQAFFGQGPFEATATPSASNGHMLVRVDSVVVSGRKMPDAVAYQLQTRLQEALDAAIGTDLWIVTVTAESGTLTLTAVPLP